MPFYPAAVSDVHPAAVPGTVACRCCPGRLSRSARARRYPSDMSEAEWAVCEPLLPAPAWLAGHGGRPASWCMRDIVDAIRYLTHNGPVWRALPADFPPAGTVYWWADKWQADGSAERMHDDLRDRVRPDGGGHRFPVGEGLGDDRPGPPRLRSTTRSTLPRTASSRSISGRRSSGTPHPPPRTGG